VTDVVAQYIPGVTYGVDTIVTYYFWNDQSKEPIAVCYTDRSQLRVTGVQFKNIQASTSRRTWDRTSSNLDLFPNPSGSFLHIRTGNLPAGEYRVSIHNLLGQEVIRKDYPLDSGTQQLTVGTNQLLSGTYLCILSSVRGPIAHARFVKE
ncbi:MAG: T9SS type A sorting domain-containing protein, partial [Saprospiraceae bacterium]|nr:T9SS type A sorting domain-containing protein [Saprospiraceae bacterium]